MKRTHSHLLDHSSDEVKEPKPTTKETDMQYLERMHPEWYPPENKVEALLSFVPYMTESKPKKPASVETYKYSSQMSITEQYYCDQKAIEYNPNLPSNNCIVLIKSITLYRMRLAFPSHGKSCLVTDVISCMGQLSRTMQDQAYEIRRFENIASLLGVSTDDLVIVRHILCPLTRSIIMYIGLKDYSKSGPLQYLLENKHDDIVCDWPFGGILGPACGLSLDRSNGKNYKVFREGTLEQHKDRLEPRGRLTKSATKKD